MDKVICTLALYAILNLGTASGQLNEGMNIPYAQGPSFANAQAAAFQSGPAGNNGFNRRIMDYGLTSSSFNDGGGQFSGGGQAFATAYGASNGFANGRPPSAFNNGGFGGPTLGAANSAPVPGGASNVFSSGGQASSINNGGGFGAAGPQAPGYAGNQNAGAFTQGGPDLGSGAAMGQRQAPGVGANYGNWRDRVRGPPPSVGANYGNWRDRVRGQPQPAYPQPNAQAGQSFGPPPNQPPQPNYQKPNAPPQPAYQQPNAPANQNFGPPPNQPAWNWRDRARGPPLAQQPGYQQPNAPANPNYDQQPGGGGMQPGQFSNAPNDRPLPESILKLRKFLNKGKSGAVTDPPPGDSMPASTPNPPQNDEGQNPQPSTVCDAVTTTQSTTSASLSSSTTYSTTPLPIGTSSPTTYASSTYSTASSSASSSSSTPTSTTVVTTAKPKKRKTRRPKVKGILSTPKDGSTKASGQQCDCQGDNEKKSKKGKSRMSEFKKILTENGKSGEGFEDELRDFGF